MPPRSKRKAADPPNSGGAAKGARKNKGGSSSSGTKQAGKSNQAAASGGTGSGAWAIHCTRSCEIVQWDDETFVDCYGSEDEGPRDKVEEAAEEGDASWFHDTGSSMDSSGQLVVYATLEAANAAAAQVFADMQTHHPDDWRPALKTGKKVKNEYGNKIDEYLTDEEAEHGRSKASEADGSGGSGGGSAARWQQCCKKLAGGRLSWNRSRHFFVDPWQSTSRPLRNVVLCCEAVEVVAATLKP
ncbi:hypothetical protein ABPG75_004664 [Micractinium tetrahymenae]